MRAMWMVAVFALVVSSSLGQDKAGTTDKDKIQGTWVPVAGTKGGKDMPAEMVKGVKISFTTDKMILKGDGKSFKSMEYAYKIDPTKMPKEMDVTFEDGKLGQGIYELDGDNLKIAHGELGEARPKDFTSKDGSNVTVMSFKREKAEKK
jgi:uncharacterized protein (TIGR03067 family)